MEKNAIVIFNFDTASVRTSFFFCNFLVEFGSPYFPNINNSIKEKLLLLYTKKNERKIATFAHF